MKKLIAVVILLVVALAAGWFGGPYLTVHGLSRAIEERDSARLERYVDFPQVRRSLHAQMNDYMVRRAGPALGSGPFASVLYGLGDQFSAAAVDTLVTPMGIAALLQGQSLWSAGTRQLHGNRARSTPSEGPAQPLREASHAFQSLDRFVIEVDRGPGQPPLRAVLAPQGLRWKVVDVQLGLADSP